MNKLGVQSLASRFNLWIRHNYEGKRITRGLQPSADFSSNKNIRASLGWQYVERLWENRYFGAHTLFISISANPTGRFGVGSYYSEGTELDYWNIVSVWQRYFSVGINWNPNPCIELVPSLYHISQYEHRGGLRTYSQWNGLLRVAYFFNKELFLKLFLQGNSYSDFYTANFLFAYTFRPGSTLYVAYNSDYSGNDGRLKVQSRIVFVKVSYLLGL